MPKGYPNSAEPTTHIRVGVKTCCDAQQLARELSAAQKKTLPMKEVMRRAVNFSMINKDFLLRDAEAKRRMRR